MTMTNGVLKTSWRTKFNVDGFGTCKSFTGNSDPKLCSTKTGIDKP